MQQLTLVSISLALLLADLACAPASPSQHASKTPSDSTHHPEPLKMEQLSAAHPFIRFVGRVDRRTQDAPRLAYPGAEIRLRFTGSSLSVAFHDFGKGTATTTNYYDVAIDDRPFVLLELKPGRHFYPLASDLSEGEHQARLIKRSEGSPGGQAGAGTTTFLGLQLSPHAKLLPPSSRERTLEFIGDSITCGYGNEISTTTPEHFPFTTRGSNARKAYGSQTAEALDADYVALAYSGRGIYRNWADDPGATVPELYDLNLPDDPSSIRSSTDPPPDAVLINLGTNDFSPGTVDREAFVLSYLAFLNKLRQTHSGPIVLLAGPQLSDGYPEGTTRWTDYRADLARIIEERREQGDRQIQYFEFRQQTPPYGQDWHPTQKTHTEMRDQLVPFLRALLNWPEEQ